MGKNNNRHQAFCIAAGLSLSLVLSGCSQTPKAPESLLPSGPQALAVTATHKQHFQPGRYDRLIIEPIYAGKKDQLLPERKQAYAAIESILVSELKPKLSTEKGPRLGALTVRYGLVSGQLVSDSSLINFFGNTPGLTTVPGEEKMTIAVSLIHAETGKELWKGAAQGFVAKELSRELQLERARQAVHRMLATIEN
ncbi:hypothetical protein [Parendozoicomonas haliclonae]|uniref:DUF4136 domain-containing protein n=1 Tax=Parendozoicomonas haliclonae TaxID=1960125 RepID=A0A1X7AM32_9GAMM|nr:hypothetical protein [Parendozoicomonas haliclonae]SMA49262.1 hypothetical protein EHSB41UT_03146 [Parendozoicomonas haliclonae]